MDVNLVDSCSRFTIDLATMVSIQPTNEPDEGGGLQERLSAILNICLKMNSERDASALLDLIAREATALLQADRASIFLLERDKRELWSKVALGSDEILRFDARLGIAGAAALNGQTIIVKDAHCDPRFYPAVDAYTGYRTQTLLAVPLRKQDGEIIGAFEVLNKKNGTFTAKDEETLKSLAIHAGTAIQTAQLVRDLTQQRNELSEQNEQLRSQVQSRFSSYKLVGTSPQIQNNLRLIERIRDSPVDVLITGESGTGKELVARAIHYGSARAHHPLVALNCAALPDTLVEAELLGIEKGVATGVLPRTGKFQAADGGTLFLDEIGDLSLSAQSKVLRALQERVVERVGGRTPIPVDVRVLTATNKDLEAEIQKGTFREDLYYRLNVIHIHMPPLREMKEDIPLLANHFLAEYCQEMKKKPMKLSPGVLQRLVNSPWPGNVRQLSNEIKRFVACAHGRVITEADLLIGTYCGSGGEHPEQTGGRYTLQDAVAALEKRLIEEALEATHHNQLQAAKAIGLSRQGLINKMKRYGIRSANSMIAKA